MSTGPYLVGLLGAVVVLVWTLDLLRRRHLREKFAAIWLVVTMGVLSLAVFPGLLFAATQALGFGLPVNLLFFVAAIVELLVSMQLSVELGRREVENRRLAEELSLLALRVEHLEAPKVPLPDDDVHALVVSTTEGDRVVRTVPQATSRAASADR